MNAGAKIVNGWNRVVDANVGGFNKQRHFFTEAWDKLVHKFDWLPEMFSCDPAQQREADTLERNDRDE